MSLEVIEIGAIQKLGCGFLFAFHSNYGNILHCLRDYSDLLAENRGIFIPHLYLVPRRGWPRRNSWRCLMLVKLEWLGYRMVKKLRRYVKPFSSDTGTLRTDRQTDWRTDRRTDLIYQYRASVCWRAKNSDKRRGSRFSASKKPFDRE